MAFQIKDFASITASIINYMRATTRKITDYLPGSVARTLVEGPATEVEELYMQFFNGVREAIPTATFRSFNFGKLPARYARGFVSVSVETPLTADLPIPQGTQFKTDDGRTYLSTAALTWASGSTSIRVAVIAETAGLAYNVSAGVINSSPFFNADTFTVSNSEITTGADAESDSERETRFADFVAALSKGTVVADVATVKQARIVESDGYISEYVTRVGVREDPGYVRLYVYSSAGEPSAALLSAGQRLIDGYRDPVTGDITPGCRAGGVRTDVLAMTSRAVPLTGAVAMLPGYTLDSTVRQAITDNYAALLATVASGDTLYIGSVEAAVLSVPGVMTFVPSATSNIVCGVYEALIPGTVTITSL